MVRLLLCKSLHILAICIYSSNLSNVPLQESPLLPAPRYLHLVSRITSTSLLFIQHGFSKSHPHTGRRLTHAMTFSNTSLLYRSLLLDWIYDEELGIYENVSTCLLPRQQGQIWKLDEGVVGKQRGSREGLIAIAWSPLQRKRMALLVESGFILPFSNPCKLGHV